MKKFLPGIIGVILAASCSAFILKKEQKKGLDVKTDWCSPATKQWFMITLECAGQKPLTQIRDYRNYKISNTDSVTAYCNGYECICSILACPQHYPNQDYPDISSTTSIYTELYNYYNYGLTYGDITMKNSQN